MSSDTNAQCCRVDGRKIPFTIVPPHLLEDPDPGSLTAAGLYGILRRYKVKRVLITVTSPVLLGMFVMKKLEVYRIEWWELEEFREQFCGQNPVNWRSDGF